ncbi:MAG: substrate-binding periplasmic protein, partial [Algiphilus sp.]
MAIDAKHWPRRLLMVATACFSVSVAAESGEGVLRVAVYENFEPYSCTAESAEGLFGVDVEIAQALAKRLDRRAEVTTYGADDTMDEDLEQLDPPGLDAWGQPVERTVPHLLMHVPQDPRFAERNPDYRFTAPYYFESMAVLYDREGMGSLPDQVDTAAPFRDARIGVELYTLSYTFATNGFSGQLRDNTRTYDKLSDAITGLIAG